jgi:hypothetical protein
MAAWPPARGNTHSAHSQRRTADSASEKVRPAFPGQLIYPTRFDSGNSGYNTATAAYNPTRHGAARSTVPRHQPRVVSRPRHERGS